MYKGEEDRVLTIQGGVYFSCSLFPYVLDFMQERVVLHTG